MRLSQVRNMPGPGDFGPPADGPDLYDMADEETSRVIDALDDRSRRLIEDAFGGREELELALFEAILGRLKSGEQPQEIAV